MSLLYLLRMVFLVILSRIRSTKTFSYQLEIYSMLLAINLVMQIRTTEEQSYWTSSHLLQKQIIFRNSHQQKMQEALLFWWFFLFQIFHISHLIPLHLRKFQKYLHFDLCCLFRKGNKKKISQRRQLISQLQLRKVEWHLVFSKNPQEYYISQ